MNAYAYWVNPLQVASNSPLCSGEDCSMISFSFSANGIAPRMSSMSSSPVKLSPPPLDSMSATLLTAIPLMAPQPVTAPSERHSTAARMQDGSLTVSTIYRPP